MKLNITNVAYLFVRLLPMIIFFYFVYRYILAFDINTLYFLVGLIISCMIVTLIGTSKSVQAYKNLDPTQKIPELCNTLLLTKNGPLSALPLSQAMLGYILFFIFYILFKYGLIQQNIQYLVLFPVFICVDMFWNIMNSCMNPSLLLLSLVFGSALGLAAAYIIDKKPETNLPKFQNLDNSGDRCVFNTSTNTFVCYGPPDTA